MKLTERLLSPNLWIAIATVLAIAGLVCLGLGVLLKIPLLADIGIWLGAPLVVGGALLTIILVPVLLLRRR
jgi:hypothetical protein